MKSQRSTIFGFAILVVLLTAGAAQSLSGSNTVFSDDIVDGSVTSADIKDQGVLYADIKDGAMTGKKILDNSITGADVNELSLVLPPGPAGEAVKMYVWTEDVVNVPTTMVVDSDDLVPKGVRLEATAIEVTAGSGALPTHMSVGASVGGQSLASLERLATRSIGCTAPSGRRPPPPSCDSSSP